MASRTITTCDFHPDGERVEAVDVRRVTLNTKVYEADVCEVHAEDVDRAIGEILAPFRPANGVAQRSRRMTSRAANGGAPVGLDTQAIRDWARAKGYDIADRGRIPGDIITAYTDDVYGKKGGKRR